jgi:hypothetical protein
MLFVPTATCFFRPTVQPQSILAAEPNIGRLLVHIVQKALLGFQPNALEAGTECKVHGEAVPATFQQELNEAIGLFVADRNVERFTGALVQAAKASGPAK